MIRGLLKPVLVVLWLSAPLAYAQGPGDRNWGRLGESFFADPEVLENRIDRSVERYIERFTSRYDLNDKQVEQVRNRLEELKADELIHVELYREERQLLGEELRELWKKRNAGEEIDTERMREIFDQLRKIWRDSPLLNSFHATSEVEKLLPADQVAKGRERREKSIREFQKRQEERMWLRRVEQGRLQGSGDRDWWDRHVEIFIDKYRLDSFQQSSAYSILRTLKQERDRYRESKLDEYKEALKIDNPDQRSVRMSKLNKPIDGLFEELNKRLNRIPTAAQKELVSKSLSTRPAQSQPASSSSRPSGVTTQPAHVDTQPASRE
ncbi:MAG: hypothetical protein JSV03_05830 [Planctomycetota bacterium]|nr:MAG: hypothetical protein JSV03_05830 [Planctomycetota bacterium]